MILSDLRRLCLVALAIGTLAFCGVPAPAAGELQTFPGCTLVTAPWSDGDSFPVRFPDGREVTVRLYGVDCLEMHVNGDESNARRLRDQRRYFGIADIQAAKQLGEIAKTETTRLLAKPFTVATTFADGRGDGRFGRIYAFVTTAAGADLSETLVSTGLARAFGVTHVRPDGTSANEWRERLKDRELTAAHAGLGAWKLTDWTRLASARSEARSERAEIEVAQGRAPLGEGEKIRVNTAPRDVLTRLPGIGEAMANRIIERRPYRSIADLEEVPGIGPALLKKIGPLLDLSTAPATAP